MMAIKSRFPSVLCLHHGGSGRHIFFGVTETKSSLNSGEPNLSSKKEQEERPKFGPCPKFDSVNFDFKKELEQLPFPVNIGEVELSLSQQKCIFSSSCTIIKAFSHYVMRI